MKFISKILVMLIFIQVSTPTIIYSNEIIDSGIEYSEGIEETSKENESSEITDEIENEIKDEQNEVNTDVNEETQESNDNTSVDGDTGVLENDNKDISTEDVLTTNSKVNDDEIIGSKYEIKKLGLPKMIANEDYLPKEYINDIKGIESIQYLVPKTESQFEIVYSMQNGDYLYVDQANNYEEAKNKINNIGEKYSVDESYIPAIIDSSGKIVYATHAMGRVVKHIDGKPTTSNKYNTDIYNTATSSSAYTYINHGYVDDVPVIDYYGDRVKIEVAGYTGWIDKYEDIIIVPLNQVINPSYFFVKNGELRHYISSDITSSSQGGYTISIGPAPKFMNEGIKYYSHDGTYFYKDLYSLISDTKSGNNNNAINSEAYYNYYLSLPIRSKSSFGENEINKYINNNTPSNSILRNKAKSFIAYQEQYGINAMLALAISMNESGKGTSKIAREKNNIFGLNAIDSDVGQASQFNSIDACVKDFAKNWMSSGYSDPQDWRYRGGNVGNKNLGINVKYASDPYWGEKAVQYIYEADKYLSGMKLKEFDRYQLGLFTGNNEVRNKEKSLLYNVREIKNNSNNALGVVDSPFIILSNSTYNNNNTRWYKIISERTTPVSNGQFNGNYDWDSSGYTKLDNTKLINSGRYDSNQTSNTSIIYRAQGEGYGWQNWKKEGEIAGTVGQYKSMEGIVIQLDNDIPGMNVKYQAQGEGYGWQEWKENGELAGTVGESKQLEAIRIKLDGMPAGYHIEYRAQVEHYGWLPWVRDGEIAGTVGESRALEALQIRIIKPKEFINANVIYQAQTEHYGWRNWSQQGEIAGTVGEFKRLEAIRINLQNKVPGMKIKYQAQTEHYGWLPWVNEGEVAGTQGESKRLEAVRIKLEGAPAGYHIEYRAQVEHYGWMPWVRNGDIAGTVGESKRLEAIQIRIIKPIELTYQGQVEHYGWQEVKNEGEMAGTAGEYKRLEGIRINLKNAYPGVKIKYQAQAQHYGWMPWVQNGELAGTSGESKRLEAIRIKLEGAPQGYHVEYRAQVEHYGWLPWVRDGEMAGTAGESKRMEALEIRVVKD